MAVSTTCASSCGRSAISTPASIVSSSARHAAPAVRRRLRRWHRFASGCSRQCFSAPRPRSGSPAGCPGLVTGPRDAIVVALYLGLIFGLALAAFTFVVDILVARGAANAGIAARRDGCRAAAGTLVTAGCLTYLTLWWRSANAGFAWAAPVWTLFALGVAVAISLLLGHAVSITTFAVMAARAWRDSGATSSPAAATAAPSRSTWRLVVGAGVVAFAGAAALLVLTAPAAAARDRPAATGRRFSGASGQGHRHRWLRPGGVRIAARRRGACRRCRGFLLAGSRDFPPDATRDPARAWTTIATGQPPEVHGVRGLETRRVAGLQGALASSDGDGVSRALRGTTDLLRLTRPSIASGTELRTKPFWEVAADAGLRSAVVNWWATWPAIAAGSADPLVISDRATLRLERGGALDAEIAPKELYEQLRRDWPDLTQQAQRVAAAPSSRQRTRSRRSSSTLG